jgi:sugar phosphate isomerase/epimerase
MTRRDVLLAAAGTALWARDVYHADLGMEAYIFQQYAQRLHKKLGDVLSEVIPMARGAGFHNIELNAEFLSSDLREKTLSLIRSNGLRMPSVYSGGAMHEPALATKTIQRALEIGKECQSFGCVAVVCNANPKGEGIEKTDQELAFQAEAFNRMGRVLSGDGLQLRVHNHTPEMVNGAREWRYTLHHTDPRFVSLCLDLDWVHQGGEDPLLLLKEAGDRVREIHVRNARQRLWLEALEPGDIDYRPIAEYLSSSKIKAFVVVELAYRENTVVTRPLVDDLRISRVYAERVFGIKA